MKVPKSMLDKYELIAPHITNFCEGYLNEEYAAVSILMLEKLCRKRPSPLQQGRAKTWACGIIYAVGSNNFLFDKSQTPHMRASALAEKFGISQSTAGNKAREIKKLLNIGVFDPEWTLPSKLGNNPMIWMFESSSGFVFDARYAPRDIQEELFDAGMIPFIPADREHSQEKQEEKQEEKRIPSGRADAPEKKRGRGAIKGQISFDDNPAYITDDAEPSAKPAKPIIQIGEARNAVSSGAIDDYCGNNPDFKQLLKKFSDGYIQVYNKRKVALRNEVKMYIRRNFNTWYCSGKNVISQISTARFISSDVYCKFGAGAAVYPVCRPVFNKSMIADIEYSFRFFTLDDHPFIRDMRLFLESLKNIRTDSKLDETIQSIFDFAISNFSNITESAEFTFEERPYIVALGEVCERMSFISISDTRDGIRFNEDEADAFFSMSGREKLGCVIAEFAERFVECIDSLGISGKQPDAEDVLNILQEEHGFESFMESLFGEILYNLIGDMESVVAEDRDPHDWLESLAEEKEIEFFEVQSIISICYSHFFLIFGQYLQMILPEHDTPFVFSTTDDEYLSALEREGDYCDDPFIKMNIGATIYFAPLGGYGLTPLGADWFGIDLSGQEDRPFPPVLPGQYREVLDDMLDDDFNGAVDDFMRKMLSDPDNAKNILSMFESYLDFD